MKKVAIKMPIAARVSDPAEDWVKNRTAGSEQQSRSAVTEPPPEPLKRFTIDVTESLHRRIKMQCAARGVKMADVVRDLLEREFPKDASKG